MAGSGSAVFGVFQDADSAQSAADLLCQNGLDAVATRMLPQEDYRKRIIKDDGLSSNVSRVTRA